MCPEMDLHWHETAWGNLVVFGDSGEGWEIVDMKAR